jgi:PKD repeat protein
MTYFKEFRLPMMGLFPVLLMALYSCGTAEEAHSTSIDLPLSQSEVDAGGNTQPTASILVSAFLEQLGLPITFDATASSDPDGDTLQYSWDFGDGSTALGDVVDHAYTAAGPFEVSLSVIDGRGGTALANVAVIINGPPIADIVEPATAVVGEPLELNGTSSSDPESNDSALLTFAWDFGDGDRASGNALVTHVYKASGRFIATLTVTDDVGGKDVASTTVTVCAPGVNLATDDTICDAIDDDCDGSPDDDVPVPDAYSLVSVDCIYSGRTYCAAGVSLDLLTSATAPGGGPCGDNPLGLSIAGIKLVSSSFLDDSRVEYTYRVEIHNPSQSYASAVKARVSPSVTTEAVLLSDDSLDFAIVVGGTTVESLDAFAIVSEAALNPPGLIFAFDYLVDVCDPQLLDDDDPCTVDVCQPGGEIQHQPSPWTGCQRAASAIGASACSNSIPLDADVRLKSCGEALAKTLEAMHDTDEMDEAWRSFSDCFDSALDCSSAPSVTTQAIKIFGTDDACRQTAMTQCKSAASAGLLAGIGTCADLFGDGTEVLLRKGCQFEQAVEALFKSHQCYEDALCTTPDDVCCNEVCTPRIASNDCCGTSCGGCEFCGPTAPGNSGCLPLCTPRQSCVDNVCVCPAGEHDCPGDRCVDLQRDSRNCGECGVQCTTFIGNETCDQGKCCPLGTRNCGQTCVDTRTDARNCGSCGVNCSGGACVAGQCCPQGASCGGACVDLQRDVNHCGSCTNRCATDVQNNQDCVGGQCVYCSPGLRSCGTGVGCVNLQTDARNCGGCGVDCTRVSGGAATCIEGLCVQPTPP